MSDKLSEPGRPAPGVQPPARPVRLGARISLRTALLLTALIAMAVVIWQLYAEVAPLRAEVRRLRDELGVFEIEDPERIHGIGVEAKSLEQAGQQTHRFRVYLPPGRSYALMYKTNEIPTEGLPVCGDPVELAPGMNLITCTFEGMRDRRTGEDIPFAVLDIEVEGEGKGRGSTVSMGERQNDWILNKETQNRAFSTTVMERRLQTFAVEEPVTLLRARAHTIIPRARDAEGRVTSWSTAPITTPCDGFMVWIESTPLSAAGSQPAGSP